MIENFGYSFLIVVQFLTIKRYRWKIKDGQFYTFLNFTWSSAQRVENFIHSKILQGHKLKGWKILYFQKSYKVVIGIGPWIGPLA